MRHIFRALALAGIVTASLSIGHSARAQSFPNPPASADPFWIPMRHSDTTVMTDAADANADMRDIVGDATHPAAYLASDANFLYLRMRVNGNPGTVASIPNDRGFGCLIDTDTVLTNYEFLVVLDGDTDTVRYYWNSTAASAPAETAIGAGFAGATHARVTQVPAAETITAGDDNYFVDIALPWATIRTPGSGAPNVPAGTALRFACGTSTAATVNDLQSDLSDGAASLALVAGLWSDTYVCNAGVNPRCTGTSDPDGDGVLNADETLYGTNQNNFDSDGDGIPDLFELTAPGSSFDLSAVNTDSNGLIDALDTDSDNDCVPDGTDGLANYRNQALPNADANLACTSTPATSICNKTAGVCAGCNADASQGGALACPDVAKPYCNQSGALIGRCSACTQANSFSCTGATPSCDSGTGVCSACNGNNGAAVTAACKTIGAPACQAAGSALAGRCTQCNATTTNLCTAQNPACSRTTGTCGTCTGHNGATTDAPCPNAAAPACNTAGAYNGRCTVCSPTNTTLCPAATAPACDPNAGVCVKCDGDRSGGSLLQCPSVDAPNCVLTGTNKGACQKCTVSTDCGFGHTGPTCDTLTGACIDVDTDGDGVQDEIENLLGTDPTKKDTDGDGIDDKTELTPDGGGAFSKVNTDGDLLIDALDLDSDDDGIPDADEARVLPFGPILDTDLDGKPNYRDTDDDGDMIPTKDEIADAKTASASDDVDGDGAKNWLDDDANGNSIKDSVDGKADDDNDGVPNYLDAKKDPPVPDAGASSSSSSSSSSGNSFTPKPTPSSNTTPDAGAPSAAPEGGDLEGSGCSTTGGPASTLALFGFGIVAIGLVSRRRRLRR